MCNANKVNLSCGGGGGGGGGPICIGPTCYVTGRCGDGLIQPGTGEECDVVGASWCGRPGERDALGNDISCKIKGLTTPGANPITDIWMTIPALSRARGYSWLEGEAGKIRFEENRMVLGTGNKAFTIADTVGFGVKTQYAIPLIIEANKQMCLQSSGAGLNSRTICAPF